MKPGEKGYTLVELLIAITIMAAATGAAGAAIFQIMRNTQRNSDHMTAVRQVQNAGYWISRDAQMARVVTTTDNLTPTDNLTLPFLSLSWSGWDETDTIIYYSANYTFADLTNGIGKLMRTYTSGGTSKQMLIAQYIATNTSNTSFESQVLTVNLTAVFEGIQETREYKVKRRLDF